MPWDIYQQGHDGQWAAANGATVHLFASESEARRFMTMTDRESAIQEYERRYRDIRNQAQQLVNALRELETIRATNPAIAAAIESAEPDGLVGDSTLTKESAADALLLLSSLQTWISTPVAKDHPPPLAIIYRRD